MGKGSRLLTAGRDWDGPAGSHSVDGTGRDGTGRESTISWRDRTGRYHGTGREQVGNWVGYIAVKSVRNKVEKSVGNKVGIWAGDALRDGLEHNLERGLKATAEKRGK